MLLDYSWVMGTLVNRVSRGRSAVMFGAMNASREIRNTGYSVMAAQLRREMARSFVIGPGELIKDKPKKKKGWFGSVRQERPGYAVSSPCINNAWFKMAGESKTCSGRPSQGFENGTGPAIIAA